MIFNISNEVAGLPVYASTDVSIYPNPVIDELKISINNYSSIDCNMCLYDCQGVMILNQKLTERENVMNLRSIPKGIYFITINNIFSGGGNKENCKKIAKLIYFI
ncbi:MAG: T9SS type A sorting domain-containing protein [Paludibacter sp.]|nr:T9SS type A sorting domain-containing protein [Paludibacter sp.]